MPLDKYLEDTVAIVDLKMAQAESFVFVYTMKGHPASTIVYNCKKDLPKLFKHIREVLELHGNEESPKEGREENGG